MTKHLRTGINDAPSTREITQLTRYITGLITAHNWQEIDRNLDNIVDFQYNVITSTWLQTTYPVQEHLNSWTALKDRFHNHLEATGQDIDIMQELNGRMV
jgi:hypothetical protein